MADGRSLCFGLNSTLQTANYPADIASCVSYLGGEHEFVACVLTGNQLMVRHVGTGGWTLLEGVKSFVWLEGTGASELATVDVLNKLRICHVDLSGHEIHLTNTYESPEKAVESALKVAEVGQTETFQLIKHWGSNPDGSLVLLGRTRGDGCQLVLSSTPNRVHVEKIFNVGAPVMCQVIQPSAQNLLILQSDGILSLLNICRGNIAWQYDTKHLTDLKGNHAITSKDPVLISANDPVTHVFLVYSEGWVITIPVTEATPRRRCKRRVVSGFKPQKDGKNSLKSLSCVKLFSPADNLSVKAMSCTNNQVYLTCTHKTTGAMHLLFADSSNNSVDHCRLPENGVFILHKQSTFSPLLLSESAIYSVCVGLKQENIIYKLMVYESATVADQLCHSNEWDRCSIPLHALEIGLKHRQLDTVSFYLKSRENDFAILPSSEVKDLESPFVNTLAVEQLTESYRLLHSSITEHLKDRQSKSFAEQLLRITTEYLHKVSRNIVAQLDNLPPTEEGDSAGIAQSLCSVLHDVTRHIGELHHLILTIKPPKTQQAVTKDTTDVVDLSVQRIKPNYSAWSRMKPEDGVIDGIFKSCLPELQCFLMETVGAQEAKLSNIINTGLRHALDCLNEKRIDKAEVILLNLGYDSNHKLRQLCLFTPDRTLREYLISELSTRNQLTKEEIKMVAFLHEVERLYSCPSYELAKELRHDNTTNEWEERLPLKISVKDSRYEFDVRSHCGDICVMDSVNSETASHSHILLDWIRHYTEKHKMGILLDQMLRRKDNSGREFIPSVITWEYLCSYLDMKSLLTWINSQYPVPDQTSCRKWPYNQAITEEMLTHAYGYLPEVMKHELFDELARRGIFCPAEYNSLPLLADRLSRIGSLITNPHPVTLRPDTHPVTLMCLHQYIIQHCIDNKLAEVLFFYITFWGIGIGELDLGEVGMAQTDLPAWVDMMLHFRQTSLQPQDLEKVFRASLSTEQFLQGKYGTVMDMIDRGFLGRSLATLMYAPDQLQQFITSDRGSAIKESLPRLYNALFEAGSTKQTHDITVYHLLQGNCVFDVGNLFGWQKTNTLAVENDNLTDLPHFSHEELVSRYAHVEELDFTYYLKHGRPSFAFCALIISQCQSAAKTLTSKSIQEACTKSYGMALLNFNKTHIVAACIAFMEMLGQDCTAQKLHCHVARQIYSYNYHVLVETSSGGVELEGERLEKEVYDVIYKCVYSGKQSAAGDVLSLLEESAKWEITKRRLSGTSFEAAQWWLLPVVFCKYHTLNLSTTFLRDCAEADDWVMFLTFAQMIQIPQKQLREVIPRFHKKPLQEHLLYIVRSGSDEAQESLPAEEGTVMDLLIKCSKASSPWQNLCDTAVTTRNPALAVMASNYQDHDLLTCMSSWLMASLTTTTQEETKARNFNNTDAKWNTESFTKLIHHLVSDNHSKHILEVLKIFQPMCAVIPALEFCLCASIGCDDEKWKTPADEFKAAYYKIRGKSESQGFITTEWVEELIFQYIQHFLEMCPNNADKGIFLRALDLTNITRLFSNRALNITKLHQIQLILRDIDVKLDYLVLGNETHPRHGEECLRIAGELQTQELFHVSRLFAEVVCLDGLDITVKQVKVEQKSLLSSDVWQQSSTRRAFWDKCQTSFRKYRVNHSVALQFFEEQLAECKSSAEKGHIYQKIYDWLPEVDEKRSEVFVKIWKCRIDAFLEKQTAASSTPFTKSKKACLLNKSAILKWKPFNKDIKPGRINLDEHEKNALDHLVGRLLDEGLLGQALDIATHFGYFTNDLTIITTCLNLLHGMPMENMSAQVKKLLAAPLGPRRRNPSTASLVALPGARSVMRSVNTLAVLQVASENDDDEEFERAQSLLSTLETLCDLCVHSRQCSQFVVNCFRISSALKRAFDWVLEQSAFQLLQHVICCENPSRFALARTYIESSGLPDDQVAGFVSDVILEALQVHVGIEQPGSGGSKSLVLRLNQSADGGNGFSELTELIQICENQTLLGQRLLDAVISLASSRQETSNKMFIIEVELLVSAHDCFTVGCHMEGVSSLLRMARIVTEHLAQADEYSLMIRLLTRMGRYSEMTYVFDILREHQQFELLFNKGIDKNHALRSAILDYLKVYHPSDTDMHTMVSLHFTLYREIATILEEAAKKQLTVFTEMNTEQSQPTQTVLQIALQYYSDAGDAYVKENCISHAQTCVNMARLIALQLHLLPNKVKVIGLDHEGIKAFLRSHKKFYEAYLLCNAYHVHSYWSEAMLAHVIKTGDMKYLDDMKAHLTITDSLISDTAQRFLNEKLQSSRTACKNMRLVLQLVRDIQTKYRLANSMGFKDITKDLLSNDGAVYLRDIIGLAK